MAAVAGSAPSARAAVLCIGTGNIGAALAAQLRARGDVEVFQCSRSSADLPLDLESPSSLAALAERLPGGVDHVAVTAGASTFGPLEGFGTAEKWERNLATKLTAVSSFALRLVHGEGAPGLLRDGGSITITTGQSAKTVNRMWPGLAANNAGLDMFVRCGGLGLPRGLRLNAVSPALVKETAQRAGMPTEGTVPAESVAAAFLPLIFGDASGQVVEVGAQVKFETDHRKGEDEAEK